MTPSVAAADTVSGRFEASEVLAVIVRPVIGLASVAAPVDRFTVSQGVATPLT